MKKKFKAVIWVLVLIAVIAVTVLYAINIVKMKTVGDKYPVVTMEIENYGTIKMELYPQYAPNTVANMVRLVQNGFYNGKIFYGKDTLCMYLGRDENGETVDPTMHDLDNSIAEDSELNEKYTIAGEFYLNGYEKNTMNFEKGVVSLIRNDYTSMDSSLTTESYNSGNSQLGIMMSDDVTRLDGAYAAFGKIIEGMDVLENIYTNAEIKADDSEDSSSSSIEEFATYPKITSATVETNGVEFSMPETEEYFDFSTYYYNKMYSSYGNE